MSNHDEDDAPPMLTTFDEAAQISPFELARRLGDPDRHDALLGASVDQPAAALDELAIMAALSAWLRRSLPLQVHQALAAGATLDQVTAAAGVTETAAAAMWRGWAAGQTNQHGTPSLERLSRIFQDAETGDTPTASDPAVHAVNRGKVAAVLRQGAAARLSDWLARARWVRQARALGHTDLPAWPTSELLAVALILNDHALLADLNHTPAQALERLRFDIDEPTPAAAHAVFARLRAELAATPGTHR